MSFFPVFSRSFGCALNLSSFLRPVTFLPLNNLDLSISQQTLRLWTYWLTYIRCWISTIYDIVTIIPWVEKGGFVEVKADPYWDTRAWFGSEHLGNIFSQLQVFNILWVRFNLPYVIKRMIILHPSLVGSHIKILPTKIRNRKPVALKRAFIQI